MSVAKERVEPHRIHRNELRTHLRSCTHVPPDGFWVQVLDFDGVEFHGTAQAERQLVPGSRLILKKTTTAEHKANTMWCDIVGLQELGSKIINWT